MKTILPLVCLMPSICFAALTVTETNGQFKLTSTSGAFSPTQNILIHEDFESGQLGAKVPNVTDSNGIFREVSAFVTAEAPSVSKDAHMTGGKAAKASFTKAAGNYNSTIEYKNLGGLMTVYVSYYFKVTALDKTGKEILDIDAYNAGKSTTDPNYFHPSRNIKLARISGGFRNNGYIQGMGLTLFPIYNNGIAYTSSTNAQNVTKWYGNYSDGKWHRAEYYFSLSNPPGTANSSTIMKIDGDEKLNVQNDISAYGTDTIQWLTMPYYVAHDAGDDYAIYYDNIVLSKDRARVEICDAASYSSCKKPFVPTINSWSASEINLDIASACSTEGRYIYVFNTNGTLHSQGTLNCNKSPKTPTSVN